MAVVGGVLWQWLEESCGSSWRKGVVNQRLELDTDPGHAFRHPFSKAT